MYYFRSNKIDPSEKDWSWTTIQSGEWVETVKRKLEANISKGKMDWNRQAAKTWSKHRSIGFAFSDANSSHELKPHTGENQNKCQHCKYALLLQTSQSYFPMSPIQLLEQFTQLNELNSCNSKTNIILWLMLYCSTPTHVRGRPGYI